MTSPSQLLLVGLGWFPTTPGGMDRYGYELMQQLAAAGDKIDLYGVGLPSVSPHPAIALANLADPHTPLPQRLWNVRHHFRQHRWHLPARKSQLPHLDAINLHFSLYSFPVLSDLPTDVPITFTFHGPWALESQQEGEKPWNVAFKRWIENRVYRKCDRFIVLSHAFGDILHREYQVPWEQIHIVPGGVDIDRFQANLTRQQARELLGFPQDRPILFVPRRLVQRMGIDILLQAVVEVKSKVPDVWLAIAGKGALRPVLEQQVHQLGLQDRVKFLGYVPDEQLPVAYQAADLTVVPSQSLEGFGLILLESLACGTPVLSTPVGGMPEVLRPFQPTLVTETPTAAALATRLMDLLTGKISLPDRVACRAYAVNNFDWKIIAPKVREILLMPIDR
ncbi:glycosyltransferase family 4 protein [Chamaesiphon sp.]|uniref:glycosyltransferase family 4 protein n=1 Tax=Chamaesiphon sp. TaxID=2814140 RepID=UPI003594381A